MAARYAGISYLWVRLISSAKTFLAFSFGISGVHSSGQSLLVEAFSGGSTSLMRYNYGVSNDFHSKLFLDITTHTIRLDCWTSIINADSGHFALQLTGGPNVDSILPGNAGVATNVRAETDVRSGISILPSVLFKREGVGSEQGNRGPSQTPAALRSAQVVPIPVYRNFPPTI